jgi:hypothetical protein
MLQVGAETSKFRIVTARLPLGTAHDSIAALAVHRAANVSAAAIASPPAADHRCRPLPVELPANLESSLFAAATRLPTGFPLAAVLFAWKGLAAEGGAVIGCGPGRAAQPQGGKQERRQQPADLPQRLATGFDLAQALRQLVKGMFHPCLLSLASGLKIRQSWLLP